MTNFTPIAGASVDTSYSGGARQFYGGEADIVTTQGQLTAADQPYVAGQVLGFDPGTGLWKKFTAAGAAADPAINAMAILAYDVPVVTALKYEAIYVGGVFNMDALTWPVEYASREARQAAFLGTNIVAQKLHGNPPLNSGPV